MCKCTMEKVGGSVFAENLGGSALIINALPPKFLQKRYNLICFIS